MQEKLWVFRPSDIALQNNLSRQLSISPAGVLSILLALSGIAIWGLRTRR